jgi:glucosamine--fructose-6-phosphate aminotransferase (isomerizing)
MIYDGDAFCYVRLKVSRGSWRELQSEMTSSGTIGIGHTRWATHGVPNDVNSHPHLSNSGDLVIIHNGIIENYAS